MRTLLHRTHSTVTSLARLPSTRSRILTAAHDRAAWCVYTYWVRYRHTRLRYPYADIPLPVVAVAVVLPPDLQVGVPPDTIIPTYPTVPSGNILHLPFCLYAVLKVRDTFVLGRGALPADPHTLAAPPRADLVDSTSGAAGSTGGLPAVSGACVGHYRGIPLPRFAALPLPTGPRTDLVSAYLPVGWRYTACHLLPTILPPALPCAVYLPTTGFRYGIVSFVPLS